MNIRFAAAIIDQGRHAPTCVGDFNFVPEANAHIWKGLVATTLSELAEHVNGAVKSIEELQSPFVTMRVVQVGEGQEQENDEVSTLRSTNAALVEQNRQLNDVIAKCQPPRPTLTLVDEPVPVTS